MVVNMAAVNFSKPVKRELDRAGWSSLRHVDIRNLKSLLEDKGFAVSGYAEEILLTAAQPMHFCTGSRV
jgi:hypothetical protein